MIWRLILGRLKSAMQALLSAFKAYPLQAALIASLALCGIQTWRVRIIEQKLIVARAQITAGQANVVALKADKAREDARQAANTRRIDHATNRARADALAGADRYAASHRVQRPAQVAASRDASRSMPGRAPVAERVESPAPESDMVAVSRADLDACTANSVDLGLAYEWAQSIGNSESD